MNQKVSTHEEVEAQNAYTKIAGRVDHYLRNIQEVKTHSNHIIGSPKARLITS